MDDDRTDRVARALEVFLRAEPERWAELAPELVRAVGEARLIPILTATGSRWAAWTGWSTPRPA